ncbi:TPM domain-containing protein [Pontiella sulfatireligans]|uniref:TPM domain-containing protein n=1 Tax=Pontiella sulfatireligans TaxID=2750658 RepID=A0A6C2UP67_9BACT|nr:TPM domain-containing protein [Pontiella sulfatireligans]VGO22100.1 hypothetical protein SCARR_04181 [Pontiella sulfatireligans]
MRSIPKTFAVAALLLCIPSVQASDRLLNSLQPRGVVNDFASVISEENEQRIGSVVEELKQKTGAEIAVVTLQSLEGSGIDGFSTRLFNKWGIGRAGINDGLMVLASMKDRMMRIEVGYGLEQVVSNLDAERIRVEDITPRFKEGDYGEGLLAGVVSLSLTVGKSQGVRLKVARSEKSRLREIPDFVYQVAGFAILLTILGIICFIGYPRKLKRKSGSGGNYLWVEHHGGQSGGYGTGGGGFGGGGCGGGFGGGCSGGGGSSGGW